MSDFCDLLQSKGLYPLSQTPNWIPTQASAAPAFTPTQATTVLAFKYADGVLVAGDRRATSGHTIVYDRADKVLEIDPYSVMAIAGVPATAWEMARVLMHSFQFYRRTQLQEMTVDGKVRALSKLLRDNMGLALQGVGTVVPIFATYDVLGGKNSDENNGRLYFYDVMGANFEVTEYTSTGSGSPGVRGVLYYENTWGEKPLREYSEEEAVRLALRALDTAAEADAATGGVDRNAIIFPVIKLVTKEGVRTIDKATLSELFLVTHAA